MSRSRSTMGPYPPPTQEQIKAAERSQWSKVYHPIKENEVTDYTYTDSLTNINSSAVRSAYYNTDDKTVLVVMKSNGNAYRYDGVPSWVWNEFKGSRSKGTYFSTTVKPSYGPSKYLGVGRNLTVVPKGTYRAPSAFAPAPAVNAGRRVTLGNPPTAAAGTPKGLVDNSSKTSSHVSAFGVKTNAHGQVLNKHDVTFVVDGTTTERVYSVEATGVQTAMDALGDATDALGLTVKVKKVTVHFE